MKAGVLLSILSVCTLVSDRLSSISSLLRSLLMLDFDFNLGMDNHQTPCPIKQGHCRCQ